MLDRLLKPDASLQNQAQTKQFEASGETITKSVPTKSFQVSRRKSDKAFWNTQQVVVKRFGTSTSRYADTEANLSTRTKLRGVDAPYSTPSYEAIHEAGDSTKAAQVSTFRDGNRPFLGQGTRQKALNAQDRPLTIEQVRELLNKNK